MPAPPNPRVLVLMVLGLAAVGCAEDGDAISFRDHQLLPGQIDADAGFSCDFGADPAFPFAQIPPTIERDRMYMAARPGLVHGKHLPLSIDFQTGAMFSGGRYLFDTDHHAKDYREFVTEDFILDGVQFLDRPEILGPECHQWSNIGAFELGDIDTDHIVMRTERWSVADSGNQKNFLEDVLPDIVSQAEAQGLTGVWLLYNKKEKLVEIVEIAGRVDEPAPGELDVTSFFALASSPSLGDAFEDAGWHKALDRTHFLLSIWFPFVLGDHGQPSLWPNSPPLPEPYCTDGVCEVSRGENDTTCPPDCPVGCGDAVCGAGEDTHNCPGDCRIDF